MLLTDFYVRELRRAVGLKQSPLASGMFGAVFQGENPDTVIKISRDPGYFAYLSDGPVYGLDSYEFFPNVVNSFDDLNDKYREHGLSVFEIEKLQRIATGSPAKIAQLAAQHYHTKVPFKDFHANGRVSERAAGNLIKNWPDMATSLNEYIERLATLTADYGFRLDSLGGQNCMMRKNGQLVISDPILDPELLAMPKSARKSF